MALTDETKQSIITALDTSSLDESFIEAVLKRLDSLVMKSRNLMPG